MVERTGFLRRLRLVIIGKGEDEIMTVKKCLKCKKPYDVDGFDWGICPSCSQIILENVRKEKAQ